MLEKEMYQLTIIDKKKTAKKIAILVLAIIAIIELILVFENSIEIIKYHKVYQQYEAQLIALSKRERDKQAEIEKKKQEKIPKLTRYRKRKYRTHLSF